MAITPVILAGGSGERLWPLSKSDYPKQFVCLHGAKTSLFQDCVNRVKGRAGFGAPIILTNHEHRFIVAEQLRQMGVENASIIIEPVARNTAAAITIAALHAPADSTLLVMPSDHLIKKIDVFFDHISAALPLAEAGKLVTFGINPTTPETGYGYIKLGTALTGESGAFTIARFAEKPSREHAESYLVEGGYAWNSGMFLFGTAALMAQMQIHRPDILDAARIAYDKRTEALPFITLDRPAFEACPSTSIDYAVMEATKDGAVIPVDIGWSDLGAWTSLDAISSKDKAGNATHGNVLLESSSNCYIHSGKTLVAGIGLHNLVVVVADNAVLVADKSHSGDIKKLIATMREKAMPDVKLTSFSHRPWGSFHGIDRGEHYQVKKLLLKPGGKISLQTHQHRAEHWVVVEGVATVTNGDAVRDLHANESTYIPAGTMHRLENRGSVDLVVIEVQTGSYLGEDDIKRYEDMYKRQ